MKVLEKIKKIYFVGVGGIGMSALARYFLGRGVQVFGYDKTETELTKTLEREGMIIHYEDNIALIPDGIDLAVFTPAVPKDHKELNWFHERGYEVLKRSQVLGLISAGMKTIAVAGTHGKTTTCCMITHLLRTAGIDCTAFLGGISTDLNSNFVQGKSEWVVLEADEYDRSFLQLQPDIAAINSLDPDHLDIYETEKEFKRNFGLFTRRIKEGGVYFYKAGLNIPAGEALKGAVNPNIVGWNPGIIENHTFGIDSGDLRANNIRVENGEFVFDFISDVEKVSNIRTSLPGRHNVENALAAIACGRRLGISWENIKDALASFKGVKRRFEYVVKNDQIVYIDDYAHHPTELKSAIEAAKTLYPNNKLTVIFQPHLYSRTRDFQTGFAEALDGADEVLLMDIYPARESYIKGVSSTLIFDKMKLANKSLVNMSGVMESLKGRPIEILMTLGAGDIDLLVPQIKHYLNMDSMSKKDPDKDRLEIVIKKTN